MDGNEYMKRILLVEDNEHIMGINEWFLKDKGYEIVKAYNLKETRDVLKKVTPDLIVLDIMLPDGDGIEFCEKLQKEKTIPVLFLTAKTNERDIMEGYKRGGNDYLTKPYELDMLHVRIEALLRLTESSKAADISLKVGSLCFDPVLSTLSVDGEKINLSTKEFGILYCLAKNRGKQVPKDKLFKEVWEFGDEVDTSLLWSTVYRLKKKIADYSEKFYIESDHSGYEIVII